MTQPSTQSPTHQPGDRAKLRQTAGRVLLAVLTASVALPVAGVEIVVHSQATPPASIVRLGDVADVRDSNGQEVQRLAALPLMPTPATGAKQALRASQIRDFLAAIGEDVSQFRFAGSPQVRFGENPQSPGRSARDASQTSARRPPTSGRPPQLTSAELRQVEQELQAQVERYLESASGEAGAWDVRFRASQRILERFSTRATEPEIAGGKAPWVGQHRLLVSFSGQLGPVRFPLYVEVSRPLTVLAVRRALPRGTIITAADVESKQIDARRQSTATLLTPEQIEEIVGMEAGRALRPGDLLTRKMLRPRLLVKRGDLVMAFARGGGIAVRTEAKARQDGSHGDLIEVESLRSKDRFDAQVVGFREVAVVAGGTSAEYRQAAAEPRRR